MDLRAIDAFERGKITGHKSLMALVLMVERVEMCITDVMMLAGY